MYRLYWSPDTAAFGPQVMLEEAGLEYECIEVNIDRGENADPAYLDLNPTGRIPALILPDGALMFETAAIMLYLADHHQLDLFAPRVDDPERPLFYRSLFYLSNTIQIDYRRYYYADRMSTDDKAVAGIREKAVQDLIVGWALVDDHLQEHGPYHLGKRFSLVDVYLVMLATWFEPVEMLFKRFPGIKRCFDLVAERPAVQKCLASQ